jgi:phosphatidyl-myo-inositol alpha-mannosyltransferase
MKVLLVCPYSWTTPGGVGAHVANLARALRERGHEARVLAPADGPVEPGVISVGRSFPVPYNGSIARLAFGPRVAGRVRVAVRRGRPDILHVHEPFAPSVGLLAVTATRVTAVATFHASAGGSRIYRAASPALRPVYRRLAGRIAVSEEARSTVEKVLGDGIRVIPNGVDCSRFAGLPSPVGETILFVGRLEQRKGAPIMVEAFTQLAQRRPLAELVLVGEGPERRDVEAAIPDALRERIVPTGRVDAAELPQMFGRASVVCAPSLGGESFGIVLLEAMASGRPVVASSIPGYAAVVRDGVDGILVSPGDAAALAGALETLLADPARASAMGRAGAQRARSFDWSVIARQVEDVYAEALERPRKRKRR